jgi:hypothetical protein
MRLIPINPAPCPTTAPTNANQAAGSDQGLDAPISGVSAEGIAGRGFPQKAQTEDAESDLTACFVPHDMHRTTGGGGGGGNDE